VISYLRVSDGICTFSSLLRCTCTIVWVTWRVPVTCPQIYRVRLHLAWTFHLDAQVLDCPFLQPIGLVDYKSLKKSICRVRLFSSRFLKQFMDCASASFCDRLFHLLMTLYEKKYKHESQRQCFFTSFQVCPLVEVSGLFEKSDQGVDDNSFIIWNK